MRPVAAVLALAVGAGWVGGGRPALAADKPPAYIVEEPIVPANICLTLLVRDGLGLPTVKSNHQPAAVKISLPRRLESLAQVDLLHLGLPPGVFLDQARLAPYTVASGALMPLHSPQSQASLVPGSPTSPQEQTFLSQLSDLLSRLYANSMGADALLGQGLTVSPPINTFTGNLFMCSLDASALWKGLNVMFYRVYNGLQRNPGPFGPGWQHNFASRLDVNEDQSIQYTRWDGSRFCYKPNGTGGYTSPEGFDDSLTRSGSGWAITDATGLALLFDGTGRMTQISNRYGFRLVMDYQGDKLVSVRNMGTVLQLSAEGQSAQTTQGGPGVFFAYDVAGRIRELRSTTGMQAIYTYDDNGRLASVSSNMDPASVEYRYDNQGRLSEIRQPVNVTGKTPVDITFLYDEKDRVSGIVGADGTSLMKLSYRWAEDRTTQIELGVQHTIVTDRYDPRGVLEERVEMDQSLDPFKQTAGGGKRQRRDTDERLGVTMVNREDGTNTRWTYDDQGRLTRAQDSDGSWVEMSYDDAGNVNYLRESGGRWIRMTYLSTGEISQITLDDNSQYKVDYDDGGVPRALIGQTGEQVPLSLGLPNAIPMALWEF